MIYVGIDFSINSTGVTIFKNDAYYFHAFPSVNRYYNINGTVKKSFRFFEELKDMIKINFYTKVVDKEKYEDDQIAKVKTATDLVDTIMAVLPKEECIIGLEGFSYNSYGKSEIDLIMFNAILRYKILQNPKYTLKVIAPKSVKMGAGNGNAKKVDMVNKFKEQTTNVINTDFFKYVLNNNDYFKVLKEIVEPPIADLVDSYFICEYVRLDLNPKKPRKKYKKRKPNRKKRYTIKDDDIYLQIL